MGRRWGWLLIPILFALLVLTPPVRRAELWSIDQRFLKRNVPPTQHRVVVVALDARTDEAWKAEPFAFWGEHLARLIDKSAAAGARTIGIDLVIQVDTDSYLEQRFGVESHLPNLALENALAGAGGKVVLARTRATVPLDSLVEASGGQLGLTDLPKSDDGVRREVPGVALLGANTLLGFANAVAKTAGYSAPTSGSWWVDFRRDQVPTYSALDLLHGKIPPSALRDKIVLIGATFAGTGDYHDTPIQSAMPGVELQAQAVETLTDRQSVNVIGVRAYPAFALVSSLPVVWLSRRLRWSQAAIAVALALALYSFVCLGLAGRNVLLPLVPVWVASLGSLLLLFSLRSTEEFLLRAKVESTFGAFVSNKVRDVVLAHEGPIGSAPPTEIEATCLFLDIRDFVAMGSTMSPQEVVAALNAFFQGALAAIEANDGLVSVFTGDGFLAIFGTPIVNGRHAECAWRSAQEILASLESFNSGRQHPPWRVGIGIHNGPVLSAYVGALGRFTYTVMGDTVNLSSRIQDSTKLAGKSIGISSDAWAKLETPPAEFQWVQVPLKGKEAPVSIYYV